MGEENPAPRWCWRKRGLSPPRIVGRHGCGLLLLLDRLAVDYLRVIMLEIDGVERLDQRQVEHGEIDCRLVADVAVVVPSVDRREHHVAGTEGDVLTADAGKIAFTGQAEAN